MASFGADVRRGDEPQPRRPPGAGADADRAAFEAERAGSRSSRCQPDGELVRAGRRDRVRTGRRRRVRQPARSGPSYGLDILGDPLRAEAARSAEADDLPTLSRPIALTRTGRIGYLGVTSRAASGRHPRRLRHRQLRHRRRRGVGAGGGRSGGRRRGHRRRRGRGRHPHDRGGGRSVVAIGGRTIEVRADDARPIGVWPAIVVAAGALGAAAALAVAIRGLRRSERAASTLAAHLDQRAQPGVAPRRPRARADRGAGREPTSSPCSRPACPAVTGADEATVSFVDGDLLRPVSGTGLVPLETHLPTTEAVPIVRRRHGRRRRRLPARPHRPARRRPRPPRPFGGGGAAARHDGGTSFGVLGLEWHAHADVRAGRRGDADDARLARRRHRPARRRHRRRGAPCRRPGPAGRGADAGHDDRPGRVGVGQPPAGDQRRLRRAPVPNERGLRRARRRRPPRAHRHLGRHRRRARRRLARRGAGQSGSRSGCRRRSA